MNTLLNNDIQSEVLRIAPSYGFSEQVSIRLLSESENKIFLIDDPNRSQKYVARINSGRLVYHTQVTIESEMEWLQAVYNETKLIVPEVLLDNNGASVQKLNVPSSDTTRYMAVYSFLPGKEIPEKNLSMGLERLGEVTAQLHQHARIWNTPDKFDRPDWSEGNILANTYKWGHWKNGVNVNKDICALLMRAEQKVLSRIGRLERDRKNYGLIHADLRMANILADDDKIAVIDFDDCGFGWYIYDLAAALSFLEDRSDVSELIERWMIGYNRHSQFEQDIVNEIQTFIILRRLQLMGWVGYQQAGLPFARDIGAQFTLDTCRLAREYLAKY